MYTPFFLMFTPLTGKVLKLSCKKYVHKHLGKHKTLHESCMTINCTVDIHFT